MRKKIILLVLLFTITALACQTVTRLIFQPTITPTATQVPTYPPDATPPEPSPTPTLVAIDKNMQHEVFDDYWTKVDENYLYEDFNGLDWNAEYDRVNQLIDDGLTTEEFYHELEDLTYSLGDDHSVFLNPQYVAAEDAEYQHGNDYVGIGVWVQWVPDRDRVVVLLTFPGGPADEAGIQARDSILSIEGQPALTEDGDNLDLLIGVPGTQVSLTVQSPGGEPRQVTVTRGRITGSLPVPSFLFTTPEGKHIGYLLVPTFSDSGIPDEVHQALRDLGKQAKLDGIIIDNRMNGGGYDNVMADTLSFFADGLMGNFSNRDGKTPLRVSADDVSGSSTLPLVVLVGEDTASFGEIFSGILQDQGRAALIGETTLGNVEILWGYDFPDGSRAWIAHDTFIPINDQSANWEATGLIPVVQAPAPWDLYTFQDDPAILASLDYFDNH